MYPVYPMKNVKKQILPYFQTLSAINATNTIETPVTTSSIKHYSG